MSDYLNCSQCVEKICEQGCTTVRNIIQRIEDKQPVDELLHLNEKEQAHVLQELKSIMSVYDKT